MSDSVRTHRRQPTRLPQPWDSPGNNTGVSSISFSNAWKWKVKVKSFSRVQLLVAPWTAAYQAPPSMGFSRLAWGQSNPKDLKKREAPGSILAPLFKCFFLPNPYPPSVPYVNWASQEGCLFYLRSSLRFSDLPLFYFCMIFPSLSFSHCHSGFLFPILPNKSILK